MNLVASESRSLRVAIVVFAATLVILAGCTGTPTSNQSQSGSNQSRPGAQGGPIGGEIRFTNTPPPASTGMFQVGQAYAISAPHQLSGSYGVTVYSLRCGYNGEADPENVVFRPVPDHSFTTYPLQDPTPSFPSGNYALAIRDGAAFTCYFDIGLTPK